MPYKDKAQQREAMRKIQQKHRAKQKAQWTKFMEEHPELVEKFFKNKEGVEKI